MIVFPVLFLLLRREKSAGSQPMFQTATLEFSSSKWRTLKVYQCNICQIRFSFVIEMRCEMRRIWASSLRIHHPFVLIKSNFHIAFLYVQSLWAQKGPDVDALGRGSLVGTFFLRRLAPSSTRNDHSPLRLTFQASSMSFTSGTIKIKFGLLF